MTDFIFLGSKIIVDSDCNHRSKRGLLLGRKVVANLVKWSEMKSLSRVWLFVSPWTAAPQAPFRPWDFPGKNTGVGCHFLLQWIFPTQGLNPGLPHCRQTLYCLSHQGSPFDRIMPLYFIENISQKLIFFLFPGVNLFLGKDLFLKFYFNIKQRKLHKYAQHKKL